MSGYLAGWNSSADSLQQLNLKFETKEQAVEFCERQGIQYEINEPLAKDDYSGKKDYGDNFLSKLNQSKIALNGEAHFAYDETHHESHWVCVDPCCATCTGKSTVTNCVFLLFFVALAWHDLSRRRTSNATSLVKKLGSRKRNAGSNDSQVRVQQCFC